MKRLCKEAQALVAQHDVYLGWLCVYERCGDCWASEKPCGVGRRRGNGLRMHCDLHSIKTAALVCLRQARRAVYGRLKQLEASWTGWSRRCLWEATNQPGSKQQQQGGSLEPSLLVSTTHRWVLHLQSVVVTQIH